MSLHHELNTLDHLVAELPFDLDDTARAGEAFDLWMRTGDRADQRVVDLWTYCYVRRFFLVKFIREPSLPDADLEPVVERAFENVARGLDGIREPELYARWVSVVCKRTYLTHVTRRREFVPVDRVAEPVVDPIAAGSLHDSTLVLAALLAAIARLPPYLQTVARLKFILEQGTDEISRGLDKSAPTIRAYVHKVLVRLRADKRLHRALDFMGYVFPRRESEGMNTDTRDHDQRRR